MSPKQCLGRSAIGQLAHQLACKVSRNVTRKLVQTALFASCIIQAYAQPTKSLEDADAMYRNVLAAIAEGDIEYAQRLLEQMLQAHPMHAGAWMDAALLQCHLGNEKVAMQLWREVEQRFQPSVGIVEFIALQRKQGCHPQPLQRRWQLHAGRGHTNNVNQGPRSMHISLPNMQGPVVVELLPSSMPHADDFTHLEVSVDNVTLPYGLQGSAQWQSRTHDTHHAMDMQTAVIGAIKPWRNQRWQGFHQIGLGVATLDSQLYQRHLQLRSYVTPPWQPAGPWRWHASAAWAMVHYPTLENFNARRSELGLHLQRESQQSMWLVSLQTMRDDGQALRTGGNRYGWGFNLQLSAYLGKLQEKPLILQSGIEWQRWDSKSLYIPGFIDAYRKQRSLSTTAALIWKQSEKSQLQLEAKHIRNSENIQLFSYDVTQIYLGWKYLFSGM